MSAPNIETAFNNDRVSPGQDVQATTLLEQILSIKGVFDRPKEKTGSNWHNAAGAFPGRPNFDQYKLQLNAMLRLQEDRNAEISPRSLVCALLWELSQLANTAVASVVNINETRWLQDTPHWGMTDAQFTAAMNTVHPVSYPFNNGMRQAEYVLLPYQYCFGPAPGARTTSTTWVLIIMRIEETVFPQDAVDRLVTDICVVDPSPNRTDAGNRFTLLHDRLPRLLARGNIGVDAHAWDTGFEFPLAGADGDSGHVCYVVGREMLRRVRLVLGTGVRGHWQADFWRDVEEHYSIDYARKLMLSACAQRTVERTDYYGRLAIELPTLAPRKPINHDPAKLRPREAGANDPEHKFAQQYHDDQDRNYRAGAGSNVPANQQPPGNNNQPPPNINNPQPPNNNSQQPAHGHNLRRGRSRGAGGSSQAGPSS